jgi:hypothetical protein
MVHIVAVVCVEGNLLPGGIPLLHDVSHSPLLSFIPYNELALRVAAP